MTLKLTLTLTLLLLTTRSEAAVVVTQRGASQNVLEAYFLSDRTLDIDGDGTADFRFINSGLQALLMTLGTNRVSGFIDPLQMLSDQVIPVSFGHYITPEGPFPGGDWHRSTDNGGNFLLLGYADSGIMQFANGYIAVEFQRAGSTHYGWIQYVGFSVYQFPFIGPDGQIWGYVNGANTPGGIVDSWGWETTPGASLQAGVPEPNRALFCLLGAAAFIIRRRRVALGVG